MTSGISSSDPGLISSRLEENLLQIKEEGNHARWRGRTSNPVGDGSRSWVGSTPTAFRQFSARFRRPSCLTGSSVYLGPFQQKQRLTRPRRLPDQRSPLIPKRTPARRLPATRRPAMVGQQHAHSVLAGITGQ